MDWRRGGAWKPLTRETEGHKDIRTESFACIGRLARETINGTYSKPCSQM